ncbi:NAD(P)/FAD-dependent oxidoreductase [Halomonas denitrificans]|nr:FAD-dependent oxidoreductase [Halomonas denitrificans]
MSGQQHAVLDTAIIGGGVSGLYSAWRLAASGVDGAAISVFEGSERTGGRLYSVCLKDEHSIPAELGGMFFSDAQDLVYRLCKDELGFEVQAVTPEADFAWLRATRFRMADFAEPGELPYRLADDEKGLQPHELLLLIVRRIAPEIDRVWPFDKKATMADTVAYLRTVEFDGRPLHAWGFWNLVSRVVSNEARLALADVEGTYALFSNWNALDAVFSTLADLVGNWYRLAEGYERLPERLRARAEDAGVRVETGAFATRVRDQGDGSKRIEFADGRPPVLARRVILALPTGALERLEFDAEPAMHEALASSFGTSACKIFMVFDEPWWERVPDGPGHIELGHFSASHTDLPLRQCFYLGQDPATGDGLLLGAFGDERAVSFWPPLMREDGRGVELTTPLPERAATELCRQLSEMHGVDVPKPVDGIFVDWAAPPYYAGWHAWSPGWKSWEAAATLRGHAGIHVCGEAYSAYQGWVQGALTSAEVMLQQAFGLDAPDWLGNTDCLAPYSA